MMMTMHASAEIATIYTRNQRGLLAYLQRLVHDRETTEDLCIKVNADHARNRVLIEVGQGRKRWFYEFRGTDPFAPGPRPSIQLDKLATDTLAPTVIAFTGGAAVELGLLGGGSIVLGFGETAISSGAQGALIGWGIGQSAAAVAQTRGVTATLTREKVREFATRGLSKSWVEGQLANYTRAMEKVAKVEGNKQLLVRKELMEKILSLWPK